MGWAALSSAIISLSRHHINRPRDPRGCGICCRIQESDAAKARAQQNAGWLLDVLHRCRPESKPDHLSSNQVERRLEELDLA